MIVSIHGGPEGQARPGFQGAWNYYLEELGVALIQPNVRGSTGFGKTFAKLDNGLLREDSVKDVGALLDWIATRKDLDPSRVMVMGGSYGGYMALAVAVLYDAKIRCSLDFVGISNFVTFLENTEAYRRDLCSTGARISSRSFSAKRRARFCWHDEQKHHPPELWLRYVPVSGN